MIQPRLRIVTVGDEKVGKTWLIHMLCNKEIPNEYTPTTYENFCIDKIICGQMVTFSLRDTAGRPSVDEFRSICFNNADVFLLCFAADNRESFVNLQTKWIPYSRSKVQNAKLILVETKFDTLFPEISKNETNISNNNDENIRTDENNNVPRLNLSFNSIDSEIRTKNQKNEHKAHPKISIPKSSRNPRKQFLLGVLSSKNRARSPPKLLNSYLDPTARSLASLSIERAPVSTRPRRRSLQRQSYNDKVNQHEMHEMQIEDNTNIYNNKIHLSASYESDFHQKNHDNITTYSSNSESKSHKISPPKTSPQPSNIEILEKAEIPEIDQIISDEEIKYLCIEEDICEFVKCSSKEGFQSNPILELITKICALKKRWTPPFRRRVAKV